jgi:hypothetical protein
MTDPSTLTKEQLLALLKQKEGEQKTCLHKPTRTKTQCANPADSEWGFCKKHLNTVQSKKAKKNYEQKQAEIVKTEQQPEVEKSSPIKQQKLGKPRKTVTRTKRIGPNRWGRFEDPETHILFNPATKCAYGIQKSNGEIATLTSSHIKICKHNGWDYTDIPDSEESTIEESFSETEDSSGSEVETEEDSSELEDETEDSEEEEDETEESEDSDDYE